MHKAKIIKENVSPYFVHSVILELSPPFSCISGSYSKIGAVLNKGGAALLFYNIGGYLRSNYSFGYLIASFIIYSYKNLDGSVDYAETLRCAMLQLGYDIEQSNGKINVETNLNVEVCPAVCSKCKSTNEYLTAPKDYVCPGCRIIKDWAS